MIASVLPCLLGEPFLQSTHCSQLHSDNLAQAGFLLFHLAKLQEDKSETVIYSTLESSTSNVQLPHLIKGKNKKLNQILGVPAM